jgi:hypothetical protein
MGMRALSLIFLSLDVLPAALLGVEVLLSTLGAGYESRLLGGLGLFILVPIVALGAGLLVVYRNRLAIAHRGS